MAERILIAGCGRLGSAAGLALAAAGREVYGLKRRADGIAEPIVPISADLLSSGLASNIPHRIRAVVYALTPVTRDEAGYRANYVEGLANLLAVPALSDPSIYWLFVSSTAVYGDAAGGWVDEQTLTRPERFNGRVLVEAESLLLNKRENACALRLGGIYGPGRMQLINQLRRGALRVSRQHSHWSNRIHSDDAARLMSHLVQGRVEGVVNGVDTCPASDAESADWLSARLNLRPALDRDQAEAPRANKRIQSTRVKALPFYHRYADYRAGYSAVLATEMEQER